MRHDLLSDVLSTIKNGENQGMPEVVTPASKLVKNVLLLLQRNNFIGDFEYIDDNKGGRFKITLLGKINDCNAIKPRFTAKKEDYEKYEKRFLPAVGMGFIIVSTPKGVMTHMEANKKEIGGSLLAFVY